MLIVLLLCSFATAFPSPDNDEKYNYSKPAIPIDDSSSDVIPTFAPTPRIARSVTPCLPSPCGPNSQCRELNGQAICSCRIGFFGNPLSRCYPIAPAPPDEGDPCNPSPCGSNAVCSYGGICTCLPEYQGNPFVGCFNPCYPSPCGPNSKCEINNDYPSCSCLPTYIGAPPSCRPECTINSDCGSNQACIEEKCVDPCRGLCGIAAQCSVMNHTAICTCLDGYQGDAFTSCQVISPKWFFNNLGTLFLTINFYDKQEPIKEDPCNPNPCGSNEVCNNGICSCLPEYQGDPYVGCRPKCVLNSDCGENADCQVSNNVPSCTCREGYTGDPYTHCTTEDEYIPQIEHQESPEVSVSSKCILSCVG